MGAVLDIVRRKHRKKEPPVLQDLPPALPPARARLSAHNALVDASEAELGRLKSAKAKLDASIAGADKTRALLETLVSRDAAELVDRLKAHKDTTTLGSGSVQSLNLHTRIEENRLETEIATRAAQALDAQISDLETRLADLQASKPGIVAAAVKEAAQGLYSDWSTVVGTLRQIVTELGS